MLTAACRQTIDLFLTQQLNEAFQHLLEETAMWSWGFDVHEGILDALTKLYHATLSRLTGPTSGEENEQQLAPLLHVLALSLSEECAFHKKHDRDAVPWKLGRLVPEADEYCTPPLQARPVARPAKPYA